MLPKFKSLLCLNGRLPNKSWFLKYNHLVLIAADGASNQLISNNIIPNFIIGDLDSINKKYLTIKSNIININDQNFTDFEKCLVEWGIPLFTTKTFINKINTTISLLPFPEATVSTNGLKWDITNQFYSVTTTASVRNIVINKQATIQVHSGNLLIIIN